MQRIHYPTERRKVEKLASELHVNLQNLFRRKLGTEINPDKLKAEVMDMHKDFFVKSGLKLIDLDKTAKEFKIPASVKRMILMDDTLALKTEKNAKLIIEALDKNAELKGLLNQIQIGKDQKIKMRGNEKPSYFLTQDLFAPNRITEHFKNKVTQSKEYKKYIEEKEAFQKHLDKYYGGDLERYKRQNQNKPELKAFEEAEKNYELKEVITQIELAKTQIVMEEIAGKPEKVEEFIKYLNSDAHKKYMEAFEKVNGMSFAEYEVGMLKALTASRDLERSVSKAVDEFIAINKDDELDAKIKRKAVDQTVSRCEGPIFFIVLSAMIFALGISIAIPTIAFGSAVVPLIAIGGTYATIAVIGMCAATACYVSESKVTEHDKIQAKAQMLDENVELSSVLRDTYKNATALGDAIEKVTAKEKAPQQATRGI